MLRTPWGQEASAPPGTGRASADIAGGNRANNRNHTAGGRSQIVFGNYHEPASSSYKSMTTSHDLDRTGGGGASSSSLLSASVAVNADYASRMRSRDNSSSDVFNIKGTGIGGGGGVGGGAGMAGGGGDAGSGYSYRQDEHGLPPPLPSSAAGAVARGLVSGASSNGSLRLRDNNNKQVPTPFDVPAGTAGSPMREHRSSSDIFHTHGGGDGGRHHADTARTPMREHRSASDIFHMNDESGDRRYSAAGGGGGGGGGGGRRSPAAATAANVTTSPPYALTPAERRQLHQLPASRERAANAQDYYSTNSPEKPNISTSRMDYQSPHKDDYATAATPPAMQHDYTGASSKFAARDAGGAYSPSPMTALRRGASFSNSVLVPGDAAAAAAEDAAFRGRRHYPQYHRSSNIFQN
ncbi:hypothetical protein HDU88_001253 [Geranomyces variabilis]|nr:hypothetical protein HDU88_001253 [Geranomyces variabilis]